MTHQELIVASRRWLHNSRRCCLVMTERASGGGEVPDAIGWDYKGKSILIECKVSRSDFCKDKYKKFRKHPMLGIGLYRYYMAPKGILTPEDIPKYWGLLEPVNGRIYTRKKAEPAPRHITHETSLVVRAIMSRVTNFEKDFDKVTFMPFNGVISETFTIDE